MAALAQDFIAEFHNLPGETVKSKHQSSFELLNKYRPLATSAELEFIAKNLKPTNHLERILRTDFLIFFHRFEELYEDFKTGDEITLRKLSKQDWFFRKAFKDVSRREFVDTILPSASYSLKINILKKLPVDEERVDEIFDAVCERYGIFLATVLIPKCTARKIREIFTLHQVKLTVAQLKLVFHKDPNLICAYLEQRQKFGEKLDFKNLGSLLKYIAQKNPKVFTTLFEKYKFKIRLGRRTTKRFIDSQRSSVSENTGDYIKVLNKSAAVRKMGQEMKSVLFQICFIDFEDCWESILKFYPKNHQFSIFESAYNSVHHRKFGDDVDAISEDMLKLISDKDRRDTLAKQILGKDNVTYLKYATPENCLKLVLEKLNHTKDLDRAEYIANSTECCILNIDLASLLKICELVSIRLKNDDELIRYRFLGTLVTNKNVLGMLEENHWKFVTDIIATSTAKFDNLFDRHSHIMSYYLRYLVKNERCIKETVRKYHSWFYVIEFSNIDEDPNAYKMLLIALLEIGPTEKIIEELHAAKLDCKLAYYCGKYNEQNPSESIDFLDNPRLMKSVKRILEEASEMRYSESKCLYGIKYLICRPLESLQELKKLYFQHFNEIGGRSTLMWFVRHEPKILQENFDDFLTNFVKVRAINVNTLWTLIKKYTHLELDTRTVEHCKRKLGEEGYEHKETLVKALTMLALPSSHVEFIKAYVPISERVDLSDEKVKDLYNLQGKIVRSLHYLKSPVEVLNATFDFYKGDYLRFALAPLYSSMYNLPETEAKPFIKRLDEIKAVSAKKHGVHLSCVIYDTSTVYHCLKTAKVPSLMATLKYFVRNPSEELWKILETKITALRDAESNTLKWALGIKVPVAYRTRYVEAAWKAVDTFNNEELRKILVTKMDKATIENFSPEFAVTIIKRCIFRLDDANSLLANVLLYLKTEEKFALLSDILVKFKRNCCDKPETRKAAHQKLRIFILAVFGTYMKAEGVDREFASRLSTLFAAIFSPSEAFQESVARRCMTLKDANHRGRVRVLEDESVERYSRFLIGLNGSVCKEFGAFGVPFLGSALLSTMFQHMFVGAEEKVRLCHSILKHKESVNDCLLVLRLLPKVNPEGECFAQYEDICSEISGASEKEVQLEFSAFLKFGSSKSTSLNWDLP